jgi:hypothetical protein
MSPIQRRMLLQVANVGDIPETQRLTEIRITEEDGQPNLTDAKRMLKWLAEAVGRGLELSVNTDTHKDVSALLTLLLATMGDGYVDVCLDAALEAATAQESGKNEPDFGYLMSVRTTISITTLMVMCVNAVLLPLATASITTRRDMEKRTTQTGSRIEEKINTIEQKTIDATLAWVSRLLSGQRKNDFRPRESDSAAWLEMLQTPVRVYFFSSFWIYIFCAAQILRARAREEMKRETKPADARKRKEKKKGTNKKAIRGK